MSIITYKGEPGDVTIRLGYPTNNMRPDQFARLEIMDKVSGTMVIQVELDAKNLLALMSGREVLVHADSLVPAPGHIGKRQQVQVMIRKTEREAKALETELELEGWERVQSRKIREGWQVTARRWVEA